MEIKPLSNYVKDPKLGVLFIPGWISCKFGEADSKLVEMIGERLSGCGIPSSIMTYSWASQETRKVRHRETMLVEVKESLDFCAHNSNWPSVSLFIRGGSSWLLFKLLASHDELRSRTSKICLFEPIPDVSTRCQESLNQGKTLIKGVDMPIEWFVSFIGQPPLWDFVDENTPPTLVVDAILDQFFEKQDSQRMKARFKSLEIWCPEGAYGHNILASLKGHPNEAQIRKSIVDQVVSFFEEG